MCDESLFVAFMLCMLPLILYNVCTTLKLSNRIYTTHTLDSMRKQTINDLNNNFFLRIAREVSITKSHVIFSPLVTQKSVKKYI